MAQVGLVQEAVDCMVKSLQRESIQKLQGNSQASVQQVSQRIELCHAPLAQAQALVTSELEKFQNHPSRRTMHCNDKANDSMDTGSKELQVKGQPGSCLTKCVDDHMYLLPTMTKKMKASLSSLGK
uniref:Protein FAM136A n=1 Tax=Prolemur simus TaxID=1328070 RepID=A0A8C9AE71_PROSS